MKPTPGIVAKHAIITDTCRTVRGGDLAAFDEAVSRLRKEFQACARAEANALGKGVQFHLILTVERPR